MTTHLTNCMLTSWLVSALVGFLAFLVPQAVLQGAQLADSSGWFLNAGRNARVILSVLGIAAAAVSFLIPGRPVVGAAMVAAGAVWSMVLTLVVSGPGSLFPIVAGLGTALIGVSVAVGTALGFGARMMLGRQPHAV